MLELLAGATLLGGPLIWAIVEMRARHRAERQGDTLKRQLVDAAVGLSSKQAEVEALELLAKVAREDGSDPNTIAWFRYAVELLAGRDLPAAELIATAFDNGMHPNDLRDAPGASTDGEARPTGAVVPLIRRLAYLTARGTGRMAGVLPATGGPQGDGSGPEGSGTGEVA